MIDTQFAKFVLYDNLRILDPYTISGNAWYVTAALTYSLARDATHTHLWLYPGCRRESFPDPWPFSAVVRGSSMPPRVQTSPENTSTEDTSLINTSPEHKGVTPRSQNLRKRAAIINIPRFFDYVP